MSDPTKNPEAFNYMGSVTMGFYQDKVSGKMTVKITPSPADEEDKAAMAITALYAAAVQKSLEAISAAVSQAGLIEQLSKLS